MTRNPGPWHCVTTAMTFAELKRRVEAAEQQARQARNDLLMEGLCTEEARKVARVLITKMHTMTVEQHGKLPGLHDLMQRHDWLTPVDPDNY